MEREEMLARQAKLLDEECCQFDPGSDREAIILKQWQLIREQSRFIDDLIQQFLKGKE